MMRSPLSHVRAKQTTDSLQSNLTDVSHAMGLACLSNVIVSYEAKRHVAREVICEVCLCLGL